MLLINSQSHEALLPEGIESFRQRSWDTPLVQAAYNQLLSAAQSEASQGFFSSWNSERISFGSMQSQMEDKVLRVTMGLRIGAPLVQPDVCCHCGEQINVKEAHGLITVEARVVIQGTPL